MTTAQNDEKDSSSTRKSNSDHNKGNCRQDCRRSQPHQGPGKDNCRVRDGFISEASVVGNETSLPGFGKFKVKATPEREARNPATGATVKVAAARKLAFTPAKALKDAMNK